MTKKRRVVITGLGLATSLGLDVEESWNRALKGECGIRKLSLDSAEKSPVKAVGAVIEDDWARIMQEFREEADSEGERRTLFAIWTAKRALEDAGLEKMTAGDFAVKGNRAGVILAAGLGINRLEDIQRWVNSEKQFDYYRFNREYREVHKESIIKNNSNRPSGLIAEKFGLKGYNATITTACASATQAIGTAFRSIARGDTDVMVAGGADSMINPVGLIFFPLLGAAAVSSQDPSEICRPFDRKRSGLVMGEGAGIAVLEEESLAVRRGARIYAEVIGYSSSMDAHKVTAPHPKGEGAVKSMANALKDAGLKSDDIDYINAHGTGTKLNDSAETMAIKKVFKENAYNIAVNSSKSMIGHLIAASGGPEFVFTTLTVNRDKIHPTINLDNTDPRCDLDYVPNKMRLKIVRAAISNSFGFGGQNASIVVKKYET
jgi:3-oxoacyl-(acyl-carrier-protein) synthase